MFDALAALQLLALAPLLLAGLAACFVSFTSPSRGLKLIVLTLPIYFTSQDMLNRVGQFFGGSQTIIFADALTLCTFIGLVVSRTRRTAWSTPNWISWAFLLFIAVSVASLVNLGNRIVGVMALMTYVQLLLLVFVVETLITDEKALFAVIRYWLYSYVVVLAAGVIGILTLYLGLDNLTNINGEQVRATFRFPNQLSLYLVITSTLLWPLASVRAVGARKRRLIHLSLPVMLAVLYYSGSRSGVTAFVAASTASLFFNRRGRQAYVLVGVLSLFVLGLALQSAGNNESLAVAGSRYHEFYSALGQGGSNDLFSFYDQTNAIASKAISEHPVLGGGIGGVLNSDITIGARYEVHNTYLGIAGQTGLLGFAMAVLVVALAVVNCLRARRSARSPFLRAVAEGCIAALVGASVHAYGNYDWRVRHLWLLLALSSGLRIAAERAQGTVGRASAQQPKIFAHTAAMGMRTAGAPPQA